jgi:hypothetical protein
MDGLVNHVHHRLVWHPLVRGLFPTTLLGGSSPEKPLAATKSMTFGLLRASCPLDVGRIGRSIPSAEGWLLEGRLNLLRALPRFGVVMASCLMSPSERSRDSLDPGSVALTAKAVVHKASA